MNNSMTIRSGIPFPSKRHGKWNFPLDDISVGDVLLIEASPEETKRGLAAARALVGRVRASDPEDTREFGVAKTDNGFGIWRTK